MHLGERPGAGRSAIPSIDDRPPAKLAVDDLAAATRRLDPLAGGGAEGMRVHRERLAELALGEHLDWHVLAGRQALGLQKPERHFVTGVEATLECRDVDWLGVRAKWLEGHRLLHVRPAQLSHAHVDRHLAALEGGPALGPRARARPLLPTAGRLARARAFATPYALAW